MNISGFAVEKMNGVGQSFGERGMGGDQKLIRACSSDFLWANARRFGG